LIFGVIVNRVTNKWFIYNTINEVKKRRKEQAHAINENDGGNNNIKSSSKQVNSNDGDHNINLDHSKALINNKDNHYANDSHEKEGAQTKVNSDNVQEASHTESINQGNPSKIVENSKGDHLSGPLPSGRQEMPLSRKRNNRFNDKLYSTKDIIYSIFCCNKCNSNPKGKLAKNFRQFKRDLRSLNEQRDIVNMIEVIEYMYREVDKLKELTSNSPEEVCDLSKYFILIITMLFYSCICNRMLILLLSILISNFM